MLVKKKVYCKKCGSDKMGRVHRGMIERTISFFTDPFIKLRKYQCLDCGWQGLRRKNQ